MSRGRKIYPGVPMTRRDLLATVPVLLAAGRGVDLAAEAGLPPDRRDRHRVPQSIARARNRRSLPGRLWLGGPALPAAVDIVSLYVDQKPERRPERGARAAPSGAEGLSDDRRGPHLRRGPARPSTASCRSASTEDIPGNEKGQRLYPRYEFFQQIVEVFRRSGRSVPVFNDKHLSWNWEWAKSMVETARAMGFPFMAGSSLPVTWRLPAVDVPLGPKSRSRVRRLRRDRQLRLSRPGDAPVHGRAPQGRRNRRRRGPGAAGRRASGRHSRAVPGMRADATSSSSKPASAAASP